jgi:FkbM family methyltransferase
MKRNNGGDGWEFHAFEPNPYLKLKYSASVLVHQQAVWTENTKKDFYINPKQKKAKASSLMAEKLTGNLSKKVIVECIDFGAWIKENFKITDYIIVKMDIEGAEYKVLASMIHDGSIHYVNKMYVEWHYKKMKMNKGLHQMLLTELKAIKGFELNKDFFPRQK